MSRVRVNYKSDLPPIEVKFKINGNVVDVPDHDFIIRFFVDGAPGASYECSFVGGEYTNCVKSSDTILTCFIDNHKFGCGRLCCEYIDLLTDRRYADKQLKTVTPSALDIVLVDGVGDDNVEILNATFDFEPNEIVSITTEESDLDGGTNNITIKQGNGEELTFHVKNGHKGSKGDTGAYVTEPDFSIVDDLETDSSTDALSAGMGKSLNGRLSLIEDATSEDVTYTPTVVTGKYITRDPSSDRGDIGTTANLNLHIYTGLTAGDSLSVKFVGEDTTSAAQAAGWYSTSNIAEMSKSTFTAVSDLNIYTKNAMGNTYSVTVPSGAPTLVLCFLKDCTTEVKCLEHIGGRLDKMESDILALEEESARIDDLEDAVAEHEELLYMDGEDVPKEVDESLDGYRILRIGESGKYAYDLADDAPTLFSLKSYKVDEGETLHIKNTSNSAASSTWVYAFYSVESLTDSNENILPSYLNKIEVDEEYRHSWAEAEFDDVLIVPEGAKLLVVTQIKNLSNNPSVHEVSTVSVKAAVEELKDEIEVLGLNKMQVRRDGENIYVAYNNGEGIEMLYQFGRVHTNTDENNTLGLRDVGYREVSRPNPLADWGSNEINLLCNQRGSDMIGPIKIENQFIGGAHTANGNKTAVNQSWAATVNGQEIADGETVDCSKVVVTAVNTISHPTWGNVLEETITMSVCGCYVDVAVAHEYKYSGGVGKTINLYYGMQSNGFGDKESNLVATIAGKFPEWTPQTSLTSFTKGSYPYYCEMQTRKPDGWHQMMRLDTTAYSISGVTYIADHKWLQDGDIVSVGVQNTSKLYHVLIWGKTITSGMKYMWKGTYKWWR